MSTVAETIGWMMWRDGQPHGSFDTTKRGLLIGYDMIPLRGLDATEAFLAERGIVAKPTTVRIAEVAGRDGYGAAHGDHILSEVIAWGVCNTHPHKAFASLCGFVDRDDGEFAAYLDPDERRVLGQCFLAFRDQTTPALPQDRRLRKTLARIDARAAAILDRLGLRIVPLMFAIADTPERAGGREG